MNGFNALKATLVASSLLLGSVSQADTLSGSPAGKFFTEYDFSVSEPTSFNALIENLKGTFTLFDSASTTVDTLATLGAVKTTSGTLSTGDYTVLFTGFGSPTAFYSFNLSALTPSSVPEPDSVDMIFSGLGLMGFIALRRRSSV